MLKIFPYKLGSVSARLLAQALRVKRIRPQGRYKPRNARTTIVNWGSTSMPSYPAVCLNKADAVRVATNKLLTLQRLKQNGIPTPEFTTDRYVAMDWLEEGCRVIARQKLNASQGVGIVVCDDSNPNIPNAPLYTKYFKKDTEYRVHVFKGKVIDYVEKRKKNGVDSGNKYIRTHNNGWVFCRSGVQLPEHIKAMAIKAVAVLGLDFGAMDIVSKNGKAVILECNTAPGIQGTTLAAYTQALREYV